jgi:hypothetical protein
VLQNFKRHLSDVNTSEIRQELHQNEPAWGIYTARQKLVPVQRHTESILLRRADMKQPDVSIDDAQDCVDAEVAALFPKTMQWLSDTSVQLNGILGRALITRLKPQSQVYRHIDLGAYYARRSRFHLVIQSTQGSPMICGDEELTMRERELWWFDNKKPHEAHNLSDQPRVHLIFDLEFPASLAQSIAS